MRSIFVMVVFFLLTTSCVVERYDFSSKEFSSPDSQRAMRLYFPNQEGCSISVSGDASVLVHKCPVVTTHTKYIYVDFEFKDTTFNESDIALYNVFIEKKEDRKGKIKWVAVTDNYYLANNYNRSVRIKNVYPIGEYRMWYGYYLKSDSLNPYPALHKRVCHFEIY